MNCCTLVAVSKTKREELTDFLSLTLNRFSFAIKHLTLH